LEIIERNNLIYKVAFSNEIDSAYKENFINVGRQEFGESSMIRDKFLFDRKFIDNIYGESILVVVYDNNKPVAARAFWRNDINRIKAYQPVNTLVLKEYRRKGIFKEMTNIAVSKTNERDLIYNFPNQNAYPQYLKLGWKNFTSYHKTLLLPFNNYKEDYPEIIDENYLNWWFKPKSYNYLVLHKGNDVFLIKQIEFLIKNKRFKTNLIIGRINPQQAHYFEKLTTKVPLLFYYGTSAKFYNKRRLPLRVVCKSAFPLEQLQIPVYKMDAI